MCRRQVASGESGLVAAELEAFLGGRRLPSVALAVSILASAVNGMNVVAVVGHYYAYGFHLFWTVAWVPISATFVAVTLVPLLYSLRVSTIFQGGLRSVVWADCIQAAVMIASPIVIIAKVFYDSHRVSQPLRPLSDFNVTTYMLRIAIGGGLMVFMFFVLVGFTAIAVIYWFRDCDPLLSGSISNYDQRQSGQAGFSKRRGGDRAGLFRPDGLPGCPRRRGGGASSSFAGDVSPSRGTGRPPVPRSRAEIHQRHRRLAF
ncbi:hypothetical protein HPB49_025360 [Dermacentor silvarum]|uniref:Uncharacterized protein n=1 Tax=Dermacentor silvarum TaxID=543639 RepID=A0ACB8D9D6_DERSI|nr:hypothetical protein HPB49_025360 [Dermacentor silvarum]